MECMVIRILAVLGKIQRFHCITLYLRNLPHIPEMDTVHPMGQYCSTSTVYTSKFSKKGCYIASQ